MSMPLVALCADEECFRNPELLGLDGENLLAQQWLMPFTSAEAARAALRDAAKRAGGVGGLLRGCGAHQPCGGVEARSRR